MKKNILLVASGSFLALLPASLMAQEAQPTTPTEAPAAPGQDATAMPDSAPTAQPAEARKATAEPMTGMDTDKATPAQHEKMRQDKPEKAEKPKL